MTCFLRVINDCNRFIAASEPVKTTAYLARIGTAWLVVGLSFAFLVPPSKSPSLVKEQIMFQSLLLLLLIVSSRLGRFPFKRGMLTEMLFLWMLTGGCAYAISAVYIKFKTYALFPDWKVYLYVFLVSAAYMVMFFLGSTDTLCRRCLHVGFHKHKIVKKSELFISLFLIILATVASVALVESALRSQFRGMFIMFPFILPVTCSLVSYRVLFLYRNHLQSIGKIA